MPKRSEFMFCPQCRRQLTKSAAAVVLTHITGGAEHGLPPGVAPTTPCPGCGAALDVRTMIAGGYDRRLETEEERHARRTLLLRGLLFVLAAGAARLALGTGLWGSLGIALVAALALSVVAAAVRAARGGPRASVCPLCGTPKTTRRCPNCGK